MSEFYFYAYTIGNRWGANGGVQCKSLSDARRTAEGMADRGDSMAYRVSVSRTVGRGPECRIETVLVEQWTRNGFVEIDAAA